MMLFGSLFAVLEPRDRTGTIFSSVWFWHGVVFTSIFNVGVVYAILFYPDWMWMYFTDYTKQNLQELTYIFVFIYYIPYAAGYYIARDLYRKSAFLWFLFLLSMITAEVWIVGHLFDRYSVVGTNEEFRSGTAAKILGPNNPLALPMNLSVGAMVIYYLIVMWFSRRKRRIFKGSLAI